MRQIVTTLVYLRRTDKLLLAMKKHGHGAGHWNGAGGKPEVGETVEQAMIRECQEEIGATPTNYHKVAEHTFFELYKGEPTCNVSHVYMCEDWEGEPTESDEMAPQWFTLTDIPYGKMWPDDIYWLPEILDGKKLKGTFHYDDNNVLQRHDIQDMELLV